MSMISGRLDIPPLERFDPNRTTDENLAILFEHQRRLTNAITEILRGLSGSISEPGGLRDVPQAKLPSLRVQGPPVIIRVPDAGVRPMLGFNDGTVWRKITDGPAF
jgi:hypothetical protein